MKTLRLLLLFVLLFGTKSLFAQDTIYKTNQEVVVAKVLEIGTYDVKYKRWSNQDGPTYVIKKTEIWKIVYPGGEVDYFNTAYRPKAANVPPAMQRRCMIGINSFDLLFGVVTAELEYNLAKSDVSIRVPFSFGVAAASGTDPVFNDIYYYSRDKVFSTGAKLLFYPAGQNRIANYYIGATGEYGVVKIRGYSPWPIPTPTQGNDWYIGTGVVNGVQLQASSRINICIDASFGMLISDNLYRSYRPLARLGITMGWRFGGQLPSTIEFKN